MINSASNNSTLSPRRVPVKLGGFSLTELLIMMTVMVIIVAVAIPLMGSSNYSVARAAARRVASDLQYAQDTAIATQKDITVAFDVDSESYSLSNESGALIHPITNNAYAIDFRTQKELSHLDIVSMFGGGSVTFDSAGIPDVGGMLTLRAGGSTFYVTVSPITGTVSVSAEN
jgi:Tfp pilus assembly protein FimT